MTHLFPTYNRLPIELSKGNGTIVSDTQGKTYLDFTSGIGVCNLGHVNNEVHQAVSAQLAQIWHTSNLFLNEKQERVAALLAKDHLTYTFFCNSGAEANEAAIKLARKHTGRNQIVTFQKSFHGRTYGAMAATGQDKVKRGFGEMLPGFSYAPFNDFEALFALVTEDVACVMLEIIQGEGGVHPANEEFLKQVESLCHQKGALLIIDEVQTGMGRTGSMYAYEAYGIKPDIITLAKGLGNGLPIGAVVGDEKLFSSFSNGTHGSTFGGNQVALSASEVVVKQISDAAFLADVRKKATSFRQKLDTLLTYPVVKDVRGRGFLLGIELQTDAAKILEKARENGLLLLTAGEKVVRIMPPLTVSEDELDRAFFILQTILREG
ncbi:acetylornithine transaminase [Listeria fleischmannii]|uniref:Acetylornithine aminotransferase n=1 Tax=Listeria fleischmannii TaxID=1069827 RepID=A0A841YB55_9LIST|nr:acetylornithine transaminase [Listeria fleischmannii]EIA19300.1 acetylornithine aminotransferase [Listeria fleischmannii subsp. coloradonensis]MBC1397512.1 acetylornithine transaminase [Listeria fleischmannii]MBC1425881.1 acetylornithine transaminase [Listeria fleischmannii]STY35100.1 Acetylornithine aminotransferase [Listeria fleischmannii subsp. coloradonensis]